MEESPTTGYQSSQSQSNAGSTSESSTQSSKPNSTNTNTSDYLKQAVNLFADTTTNILDTVAWVANQLNSPGNLYKIGDAIGKTAEISLSIPPGETGELAVFMGQTRKHYPAKGTDPSIEFKRGTKVQIVDVAVNTMYVKSIDEAAD